MNGFELILPFGDVVAGSAAHQQILARQHVVFEAIGS